MSTWMGFYACPQFEIGKVQAVELFGPSADLDVANQIRAKAGFPSCDSFLVRLLVADDGTFYGMHFIGWFSSQAAIVEAIDVETWYERRFGHTCYFELFNVVDDGDLWQAWDHDSAVACKDGGQPTDYHVYDGYKCVLDLVREVPAMLYAVTLVNELDEIVSADWYDDADKWAQAVSYANVNGNRFMSLEHQTGEELGLHIVDDWCRDEGLADGVAVLNAYYRDYRSV